jgi:hypothetical protein
MAYIRRKKGQGLSINTIIIAALGLAVLVILFAVFTGRIGLFNKAVSGTDTCQQKCDGLGKARLTGATADSCRTDGGTVVAGAYSDVQEGTACCCK